MGLETIIEEIKAKGRAEAGRISSEASQEVSKILAEAEAAASKLKAAKEETARKEIQRFRQQELSSAHLEVKKTILNAKKEILDEVYEHAKDAVKKLPVEKNGKLLKAVLEKNALNKGRIYSRSKDKQVLKKLTKLEHAGEIECLGGVVIENEDGTEVLDFKYDTILKNVSEGSLKQISDILFG